MRLPHPPQQIQVLTLIAPGKNDVGADQFVGCGALRFLVNFVTASG
jgi:hypothetical protein